MAHRHMKRCSTSLNANQSVGQIHKKIPPYICQNGHHLKSINNKCWRGCGEKETSYTVGGNVNWYSQFTIWRTYCTYEEQYGGSLKNTKNRAAYDHVIQS